VAQHRKDVIDVPLAYPASTIFLDESGVRARDRFTVGGIKVRRVGELSRAIRHLRDKHGFYDEFKFNNVNDGSLPFCYDLIDAVVESDAQIVGCVVDPSTNDPFEVVDHRWLAHAEVVTQLLIGCINRRELVCVMLDGITVPRGCSLEDHVRQAVNKKFQATSVVSAVCLDSRSNDLLQLADLVASAISFERRRATGVGSPSSAKGKVAARLGALMGSSGLRDGRSRRHNIATFRSHRGQARPRLTVLESDRSA